MTKKSIRFLEPAILLLIGAGLLIMTLTPVQKRILPRISPSTQWSQYINGLGLVCLIYGLAFIALAAGSAVTAFKGVSLTTRIVSRFNRTFRGLKMKDTALSGLPAAKIGDFAGLGFALAIGLSLRAFFLSLPLRYDECWTFLHYVNRNAVDLFRYSAPNNQVLHTLCVKLSTLVWGSHPLSIKIPSFLAGIVSIALVYFVARAIDKKSGLAAALSAAVFPYLVLFGSIGRGYSLLVVFTLALVLIGFHRLLNPTGNGILLFSALAALGFFTIPTMLFPVAGLCLWIAIVRLIRKESLVDLFRMFVVPCASWTLAFTFILYTPVIIASNGIAPIIRNQAVTPQPFPEFLRQLPWHLKETWRDISRDIPLGVIVAGFVLILLGLYVSIRKKRWAAALLLPSMIFGSAIVLFLNHRIPFPRTWIFLVLVGLVTADLGLSGLMEKLSRKGRSVIQVILIAAAGTYAFHLMATNAVSRYHDVGAFPEAPAIVDFLKARVNAGDRIRARVPADEVVKFYLWYNKIVYDRPVKGKNLPRKEFLVIKKSRYGTDKLTDKPVVKILDLDNAAVYRVVEEAKK